jgi:hypothetical protein
MAFLLDALIEGIEGGQFKGFVWALDEGGGFVANLGVSSSCPSDALSEEIITLIVLDIEINLIYINPFTTLFREYGKMDILGENRKNTKISIYMECKKIKITSFE